MEASTRLGHWEDTGTTSTASHWQTTFAQVMASVQAMSMAQPTHLKMESGLVIFEGFWFCFHPVLQMQLQTLLLFLVTISHKELVLLRLVSCWQAVGWEYLVELFHQTG